MDIASLKTSRFIKQTDLPHEGLTLIIREVTYDNVAPEGEKEQMKGVLHFTNFDKPLVLNTTNAETIADNFDGDTETDNWPGKQITLFYDMTVRFGTKRGGIRVRSTAQPSAPPPAQPEEYGYDDDVPA